VDKVRAGGQSLIIKERPAPSKDAATEGAWEDPRREVLAYQTDVVADLGLNAPRWHAVIRRDDGSVVLWLEDAGAPLSSWSVPRLAAVARRLGRAQAELASCALPSHAWLNRSALKEFVGTRGDEHVLLQSSGTPLATATRALWDEAPRLVAAVERLPRTLCHFDLHPGNLLVAGGDVTLVDWGCVGIGPIGEDAANLIATAVLDLHVRPALLRPLHRAVVSAYHAGLAEGGWSWSLDETDHAIRISSAVKFAWVLPDLLRAAARGAAALGGHLLADVAEPWAAVAAHVVRQP
jgi:phosphotransferase family enzyme